MPCLAKLSGAQFSVIDNLYITNRLGSSMFFGPILNILPTSNRVREIPSPDGISVSYSPNWLGITAAAALALGAGLLKQEVSASFNGKDLKVSAKDAHELVLAHNLNESSGHGEGRLIQALNQDGYLIEVPSFTLHGAKIKFLGYVKDGDVDSLHQDPPHPASYHCYQLIVGDRSYPLLLNPAFGEFSPLSDDHSQSLVINRILRLERRSNRHNSEHVLFGPHPELGSRMAGF